MSADSCAVLSDQAWPLNALPVMSCFKQTNSPRLRLKTWNNTTRAAELQECNLRTAVVLADAHSCRYLCRNRGPGWLFEGAVSLQLHTTVGLWAPDGTAIPASVWHDISNPSVA